MRGRRKGDIRRREGRDAEEGRGRKREKKAVIEDLLCARHCAEKSRVI